MTQGPSQTEVKSQKVSKTCEIFIKFRASLLNTSIGRPLKKAFWLTLGKHRRTSFTWIFAGWGATKPMRSQHPILLLQYWTYCEDSGRPASHHARVLRRSHFEVKLQRCCSSKAFYTTSLWSPLPGLCGLHQVHARWMAESC